VARIVQPGYQIAPAKAARAAEASTDMEKATARSGGLKRLGLSAATLPANRGCLAASARGLPRQATIGTQCRCKSRLAVLRLQYDRPGRNDCRSQNHDGPREHGGLVAGARLLPFRTAACVECHFEFGGAAGVCRRRNGETGQRCGGQRDTESDLHHRSASPTDRLTRYRLR